MKRELVEVKAALDGKRPKWERILMPRWAALAIGPAFELPRRGAA